jgi:hypothetical protein
MRLPVLVALQGALILLAGCGGQTPADTPPTAYESGRATPTAPELAGGPVNPPSSSTVLAGGPLAAARAPGERPLPATPRGLKTWREKDGRLVTAMAPVPNPESLSAAERRRIYGERAMAQRGVRRYTPAAGRAAPYPTMAKAAPARVAPAPVKVAALPPPKVVAAPPKPVAAAKPVAPKALTKAAPSPAIASAAAVAKTPSEKLTAAVSQEIASGATLFTPDALAKGEAAEVTVTMPDTLLATIQREAAKLGLGRAARSSEVTATLTGEGYEITPNGAQTAKLKAGEPAKFAWQVKPGAGEKSPLRAKIDGALTGLKKPFAFSLGSLEQVIAAVEIPKVETKGFKIPSFGLPAGEITLPGFGPVPARTAIGGALLLLVVIVLAILSRNAAAARERAAARRRFRTMANLDSTENYSSDETVTPVAQAESEQHNAYVSPMVAAAAAGAVAAAVAHHHQEEAQEAAQVDHGHVDPVPESHAPAAETHQTPFHVNSTGAHEATAHHQTTAHDVEPVAEAHAEPVHVEPVAHAEDHGHVEAVAEPASPVAHAGDQSYAWVEAADHHANHPKPEPVH